MAYMSQEKKKKIEPGVKSILKKYGLKGTLSVRNHTALVLTIKEGEIDFIENAGRRSETRYIQVNHYCLEDTYDGLALAALAELKTAMNEGNHDNSDIQQDYFDVGFYICIHIGKWDRPYIHTSLVKIG